MIGAQIDLIIFHQSLCVKFSLFYCSYLDDKSL